MSTIRQNRIKQIIKGVDKQIADAEAALANPNVDGESQERMQQLVNLNVAKHKLRRVLESASEHHSEQHG